VSRARLAAGRQAQEGVVLFIALIVLVIMALAGVAMVRQSGTGMSIAGNVAFRQNATSAGDLGTETARTWWWAQSSLPGALDLDAPTQGYFSDWGAVGDPRRSGDPSTYRANQWRVIPTPDDTGNTVSYVIERLCQTPNQPATAVGQLCITSSSNGGTNKSGATATSYPGCGPLCDPSLAIHYRISSRIQGPKGTVSYIQVMVE
jgi:type IV pilus assembly protein PilX